jgi:hypothetical protein
MHNSATKLYGSNEYSPLLPYSFVALLCMVVSAFVILLFGLLQPKYRLVVSELWFTSFACLLFVFFFAGVMCLSIQVEAS